VSRLGPRARRALLAAGAVVLVVAVFGFALPQLASYDDVLDAASKLSSAELAALAVAVVVNLVTFAPPWMAALPGLGFLRALTMTQASQAAASTLPGGEALGVALSVGMLRGWGFRSGPIAVAAVLVSVWNTALKVAFPLVALALLVFTGGSQRTLELAAAIGVAGLLAGLAAGTAVIWSDRQAHRVGEAVGRMLSWARRRVRRASVAGVGDRFVRFRSGAIGVLRRRWHVLTLATIAGNLAVFAVLLVALRALDVTSDEVSFVEAFAAWSLVRLLTAIPITPGGIGVVELGLSGALVAFGGPNAEVVAAVLLFRLLTWAPSVLVGIPCALLWRRLRGGSLPPIDPASA
jgi:putative heme transporter